MKFIFRKSNGKVLGAQALGEDGPAVDKRISALAVAIQMGATIYDLEEAELCYAPQFGSAKDPVNFAGMVAADVLRGDMPLTHWDSTDSAFLLDVREPVELAVESVPGAVNIPMGQLRSRLGELPRDREIHVICRSAQRAYYATRILLQNGFKARNYLRRHAVARHAHRGFEVVARRDDCRTRRRRDVTATSGASSPAQERACRNQSSNWSTCWRWTATSWRPSARSWPGFEPLSP